VHQHIYFLTLSSLSQCIQRASSVLNNNSKLYGANNALDNKNESTCWNSEGQGDGSIEHSFIVNFHRRVKISSIALQFQGGFAAEKCQFYTTKIPSEGKVNWKEVEDAYIEPENVNDLQMFELEECESADDLTCDAIKLNFGDSTDFYGRVILYKIEVNGVEQQ